MSRSNILINLKNLFTSFFTDAWDFFRSETFQAFGPYIVGGIGIFTCLMEGFKGIKEAYQAYKNTELGQRKTRILTSALITMSAGAGIGLATTLMVAAAGVAISIKTALMAPVLIPTLLTGVYSMTLWRKSYIFHRAKEEEYLAKSEYELDLLEDEAEFSQFRDSPDEREGKMKRYKELREARLRAECKVAFSVIEVLTSMMVVLATILGTSAFFASSAVSFGLIPAGILFVGVVVGYVAQAFEYLDKKHDYVYTRSIRNGLLAIGEGMLNALTFCRNCIFGSKARAQPEKPLRLDSTYRKLKEAQLIELTPLRRASKGDTNEAKISPFTLTSSPKSRASSNVPEAEPITREVPQFVVGAGG